MTCSRVGRCGLGLLTAVSALIAFGPANATGPAGFVDGTWQGAMVWEASATFTDAIGSGKGSGQFNATFAGGIPTGDFSFSAPNALGVTPEATAKVDIDVAGGFSGTATDPVLAPVSGSIVGSVDVDGFGSVPVAIPLGAADLAVVPLDITIAGCVISSGTFTTQIAASAAVVASAGGTLTVHRAFWSALRVSQQGAASADQLAALDQLVADGVQMSMAIDAGTYDPSALRALLRRAEEFAEGIPRNASCGIATPGHFSTAIAGVVTELLVKMVAHEDLFDVQQFWSAILAGVQAGALGSSAGPAGQQLQTDLKNVLGSKFTAAAAAGNKQDLITLHLAATTLGDQELAKQALAEADKL